MCSACLESTLTFALRNSCLTVSIWYQFFLKSSFRQIWLRVSCWLVCVNATEPLAYLIILPKLYIMVKRLATHVRNLAPQCLLHHCRLTSPRVGCTVSAALPKDQEGCWVCYCFRPFSVYIFDWALLIFT